MADDFSFDADDGGIDAASLTDEFARKQRADMAARIKNDGLKPEEKILCAYIAAPDKDTGSGGALSVVTGDGEKLAAMAEGIGDVITRTRGTPVHSIDLLGPPNGNGKFVSQIGTLKQAWENGETVLLTNAHGMALPPQMLQLFNGELAETTIFDPMGGETSFSGDEKHPDFKVIAFSEDFDSWPQSARSRISGSDVHRVEVESRSPLVQQTLSEHNANRTKSAYKANHKR